MRDLVNEYYNYFMALSDPNRYTEAPTAHGMVGKWPGMKADEKGYLWPVFPSWDDYDPDKPDAIPEMVDYYAGRKKAGERHIPYASEPGHMAMIDGKFQDVYLYHKEQERKRGILSSGDEEQGAGAITVPTSVRLRWDLGNLMALMPGSGRTGGM